MNSSVELANTNGREELDRAIDAVAAILRLVGSVEVANDESDSSNLSTMCEKWARHVLLLAPVDVGARCDGRRDWGGVVRFIADVRRRERKSIEASMTAFRETIWGFAEGLKAAVVGNAGSDDRLQQQLDRLRAAAAEASIETLRAETVAVTASMGAILEERKRMHDATLREIGARLKAIASELEEVRHEAARDALTKVFNRGTFDKFVARVPTLDGLVGRPVSLLMIDIDHFKKINDSMGHAAGDEVLRRMGDCLARTFPRRNDLVARYGGEEFVAVLRDTTAADARILAARLLTAIRSIFVRHGGRGFGFTASIGVATLKPNETAAAWVERADRALYAAKHAGRDRFEVAP
jgi:diguanylate cyclase (GGDEF)-like protein